MQKLLIDRFATVLLYASWGLLVTTVILIPTAFMLQNYDWDIDHEIYFGQRLLEGHLLWTEEFHDKLPLVPFIFTIPAYFKNVNAYRLVSLISVILAAWSMTRLLPTITNFSEIDKKIQVLTIRFGALCYVILMFVLPGGITVINPLAGSFNLITFLLILYLSLHQEVDRIQFIGVVFIASLLGSIAISMRPYLLPETAVSVIIATLLGVQKRQNKKVAKYVVFNLLIWIISFALFGFLLNILPYILSGNISIFLEGLSYLRSDLNPNLAISSFIGSLHDPRTAFFWLSAFIFIIFAIKIQCRLNKPYSSDIMILWAATIGAFMMWCYMMTKHYWGHYILLFVGPFCITLIIYLTLAIKANTTTPFIQKAAFLLLIVTTITLCGLGSLFFAKSIWLTFKGKNEHYSHWMTSAIAEYLQKYNSNRPSFLVPSDMKSHWALDEPRHGFPHAANTGHIYSGWFQNLGKAQHFLLPKNADEYCSLLNSRGPDLIIEPSGGNWISCLEGPISHYQLDLAISRGKEKSIMIFRRKY